MAWWDAGGVGMKVVAVIGPFRARFFWRRWAHIRRAKRLARQVWALGAVAYCPHQMTRGLSGIIDEAVIVPGLLELCMRCDAGILLPGWPQSMGSLEEQRALYQQGKPVFQTLEHLQAWLAK